MQCLFQIVRRRRTSRIFTTTKFNNAQKLLTSDTLVIISRDETHLIASEWPNIHLAKSMWERTANTIDVYHYDILVNEDTKIGLRVMSCWFWCSGFIVSWWSCYQYAFDLCHIISSYNMNSFWKVGSVVSLNRWHAILTISSWVSICEWR